MDEPGTIYFTGTAGAGKTTFVRAFADWMKSAGRRLNNLVMECQKNSE